MRKTVLAALAIPLSAAMVMAQDQGATDISRYEIFEPDETVKTLEELEAMEDAYQALVASGNCVEAIPAIIDFYEAANHTSNLIRRGNEPFYDADRDGKEKVSRDRNLLHKLVEAENTTNNLLGQRNLAWVEEAKCLISLGQREEGIVRLYRALDYISSSELTLWKEAQTLLWAEVGYTPTN